MVVAAHADDETLGCGGTIARHVAEGDNVDIVYMADGVTSRNQDKKLALAQRQEAAERAREVLGINKAHYLGFSDNRMDSLPLLDVIQPLERIIQNLEPVVIYTHYYGDLNVDHRITCQAVTTACRPLPGSSVREIYAFEVMSSTEWASLGVSPFVPNYYVNISDFLNVKMLAIDAYALEMYQSPHSRSVEHLSNLAYHHGHCVGVDAAEAFMVLRKIR